jgi:hypothetical protein
VDEKIVVAGKFGFKGRRTIARYDYHLGFTLFYAFFRVVLAKNYISGLDGSSE